MSDRMAWWFWRAGRDAAVGVAVFDGMARAEAEVAVDQWVRDMLGGEVVEVDVVESVFGFADD